MLTETKLCFCCEMRMELEGSHPDINHFGALHNGLIFESTGNYGSAVLDIDDHIEGFHIYICDLCLHANDDLITKFAKVKNEPRPRPPKRGSKK